MNRRTFFKAFAALAIIPNALMTGIVKAKAARKPLMFGRVPNVPAVEESPLVYRVSAGSVQSIEAVRDGGMELIIDGDDPTILVLQRAEIAPGHARTCLSEGVFRIGTNPVFPVTVDATGNEMRPRVTRMDELAGAVQNGSWSRDWRDQIDAHGLLVHTWDSESTARAVLKW